MTKETKRGAKEGLGFGLIAGIIFAIAEMLGAMVMGMAPSMPLQMFASVVLGQEAMAETAGAGTYAVGIVTHLVLSAVFGVIYGLVNSNLSTHTQTSWGRQLGIGLLFGAILWAVNFHIIARLFFPWFLEARQFLQLLMHALFFGVPLGLMYAGAERRVQHVRPAARTPA